MNHGTVTTYDKHRCHCEPCTRANNRRVKAWLLKTNQGRNPVMVDLAPVHDHVLQLRASGWTLRELANEVGLSFHTVKAVTAGRTAKRSVYRGTADALLAVEPLAPVPVDEEQVRRLRIDPNLWRRDPSVTREERIEAGRTMGDAGRKALGLNAQRVYGAAS